MSHASLPSRPNAVRRAAPSPFWLAVVAGLALSAAGISAIDGGSVLAPGPVSVRLN